MHAQRWLLTSRARWIFQLTTHPPPTLPIVRLTLNGNKDPWTPRTVCNLDFVQIWLLLFFFFIYNAGNLFERSKHLSSALIAYVYWHHWCGFSGMIYYWKYGKLQTPYWMLCPDQHWTFRAAKLPNKQYRLIFDTDNPLAFRGIRDHCSKSIFSFLLAVAIRWLWFPWALSEPKRAANVGMQMTFQGPCDCSLTFSRHKSLLYYWLHRIHNTLTSATRN